MAAYNLDRQIAYTSALHILNLTPTERRILGNTFKKMVTALGNEATPVFEQVVFAFNDALKEGAEPRSKVLAQILRYTHTVLQFGDAARASVVPMRTLSVIKEFYEAARPAARVEEPAERKPVLA